jgi:hypothetical protein
VVPEVVVKAVLLSWCFPPARFPRSVQVARLVRHLTTRPVHVWCAPTQGEPDPSLLALVPPDVEVHVVPQPARSRLTGPARRVLGQPFDMPDASIDWARHAARTMLRAGALGADDVLVTFAQPMSDHVAGLRLARRTGAPWIAHFSDPWSDNPFRRDLRPVAAVNRHLERKVIERADLVVFTSEETVELVMAKYDPSWRSRVRVLPHAYEPDLYPSASTSERTDDVVVLRHLGAFYGPRRPDPVLHALASLLAADPSLAGRVRLELIGPMERSATTTALLESLPAGVVLVRPPVPYDESLALMRDADALLVVDAPSEVSIFLPSKLVDYVGAGRRIVAVTPPGTSARIVTELGGDVADPADVGAVAAALRSVLDAGPRPADEQWGDAAVRARFAAPEVAARMDAMIAGVPSNRRPG